MEQFRYRARNRSGKIVAGEQTAERKKDVADSLFAKDMTPVEIETASSGRPLKKMLSVLPGGRVSLKERVIFSRQFATMIDSGIPIVRSLNVLKDQTTSKPLATALVQIAKDVESGSTLSDALARFPKIFSAVYVSMVRAGEVGGILDEVLERLADQMEKDSDLVSKVRGAMVYPALIFVVMIAALAFIMTVVIPQLTSVFDAVAVELPWNTKLLLDLSEIIRSSGIFLVVGIVAIGAVAMQLFRRNLKLKFWLHGMILRTPVLGTIVTKINLARFARTLGSLLGAGIPMLEALQTVSDSLGNVVMRDEMKQAMKSVRNGSSLAKTLQGSKVFPPIVPEMIAIGEETGELEKILMKLADFYDKEVASLVANLSSVIEPLMLIVMGSLVGFIVVSVIGPLYSLTSGF